MDVDMDFLREPITLGNHEPHTRSLFSVIQLKYFFLFVTRDCGYVYGIFYSPRGS